MDFSRGSLYSYGPPMLAHCCTPRSPIFRRITAIILYVCCTGAFAHGSVYLEDDLCLINLGFYSAHFTIFQPQTSEHQEFCEDIPEVTESVFVMEYQHDSMRQVPVDFRIIRDRKNRGRFVKWQDLDPVKDIEAQTVFYQPPLQNEDGVMAVLHQFDKPGDYIGIVTTVHPTKGLQYNAVFPFRVGGAKWGYWPLFIVLLLLVQINFWIMGGGYKRWREKHRSKP